MATRSLPTILRTDTEVRIGDIDMARLAKRADIATPDAWDEASLAAHVGHAEMIVTSFFPPITERVIDAAPRLKSIVKYGVGVDNIDIEAATRRGVMVVNCPEYGSNTVADHAFALLMCLARKLIPLDRQTKQSAWVWPAPEIRGVDLEGKTLGLVGYGRIGRAMARRAAGFDMTLIAHDPYVAEPADGAVRMVSFIDLLARADFISIHCILTPETRGLFDARALQAMKPSAYLIDVSRGAIIDDAALIEALNTGGIAGAGIDVYSEEPMTPGNPLLAAKNIILTSHLAWYTVEADERLAAECVARMTELLDGVRPRNIVNAAALGIA